MLQPQSFGYSRNQCCFFEWQWKSYSPAACTPKNYRKHVKYEGENKTYWMIKLQDMTVWRFTTSVFMGQVHTTNTTAIAMIRIAIFCSGMATFLKRRNFEVSWNVVLDEALDGKRFNIGRLIWVRKDAFIFLRCSIVGRLCANFSLLTASIMLKYIPRLLRL